MASDQGIYLGSLSGASELRQLTDHAGDASVAFRAGDAEVSFTRTSEGETTQVMVVPLDGGSPSPLLPRGSCRAAPSPLDERLVYFDCSKTRGIPLLWDPRSKQGHVLSKALSADTYSATFSPDGRRVAIMQGSYAVLEIDVATGTVLRSATGLGDSLYSPTYAADELLVSRMHWRGSLWLADVALAPRPEFRPRGP